MNFVELWLKHLISLNVIKFSSFKVDNLIFFCTDTILYQIKYFLLMSPCASTFTALLCFEVVTLYLNLILTLKSGCMNKKLLNIVMLGKVYVTNLVIYAFCKICMKIKTYTKVLVCGLMNGTWFILR